MVATANIDIEHGILSFTAEAHTVGFGGNLVNLIKRSSSSNPLSKFRKNWATRFLLHQRQFERRLKPLN
jgi:hypothetical protein